MLYDDKKWGKKIEVLDEVGQLMLKAADYLETHRWGQGDLVLRNGAVCLIGSLHKAELGKVYSSAYIDWFDIDIEAKAPLTNAACIRIAKHLGIDAYVDDWNDSHNRKKSEVIAALRGAAKLK